jgi:magnesium transporter
MLNILRRTVCGFVTEAPTPRWRPPEDAVWIDLVLPTREEELAVEEAFGIDLPTREETAHIEPSSRLYQEDAATFMTATLLAHSEDPRPSGTPVTFVLAKGVLITVRYEALKAFSIFSQRCEHTPLAGGADAMLELLDAVVERAAEVLERESARVQEDSAAIFERQPSAAFATLLTDLARCQTVTSMVRKSLVSLSRMTSFAALATEIARSEEERAHLVAIQHDVQALIEHSGFMSGQIAFLLDAALGLINIEQNSIIKFFSVVAVVFLPPTLVASIYGMNFDRMPELHWVFGYPFALVLMLVTGITPYLWFKKKGWL